MTEPGIGDNSNARVKAFMERVERLAEERQTFTDDIRDIYKEAKDAGFDPKALRGVVKLRKQGREKAVAEKAALDLYLTAVGMDYLL